MDVKPERTGWRDLALSLRHRDWGVACPAADPDFILVEYDWGRPVALIEYKNEHAAMPDVNHTSYTAIRTLANNSKIPFYLCRYASDFTWFEVTALNSIGVKMLRDEKRLLSERQYVKFLYILRQQKLPDEIEAKLNA